uniref:Uncharacterized protein n=1 Tax=viral metagenome TaxID=1070528 RepID=A0A6M3K4G1_9ZZZZ
MPDPNYMPSKQAQDDFVRWMSEYYELDLSFLQVPDVLIRFSNKDNPYWQYWEQNVWTPAHPQEPAPDPVESYQPEPFPDLPGQFAQHLPEKMGDIPINYTAIATTSVKTLGIDPVTGAEIEVSKPLTIYAAVPSLDQINDKTLGEVYKNIYGVFSDGSLYQEGRPLSNDELQDYAGYDPLKKSLTPEGKAILAEDISYAAMTEWVQKNVQKDITPDMETYIKEQAANWGKGIMPNLGVFGKDIEKMTAAWDIAHPEEREKRRIEQLKEKFPGEAAKWEAQQQEALFSRFDKPEEQFATEVDKLNNTLEDFQQSYDKYKPMQEQLGADAESQYANTIINLYENAQNMLRQIKGKGTITTTGYTEAGQKMTGERPAMIGQFDPLQSKRLGEISGEFGVNPNKIVGLGQRYAGNMDSPEFATLTQDQRAKLGQVKDIVTSETAGDEQQSDWNNLVKKAKAVNYPQRKVRL